MFKLRPTHSSKPIQRAGMPVIELLAQAPLIALGE